MVMMSNENTPNCAYQPVASAPKSTNVAIADFPSASVTLPKMRAHVAVKQVALRDTRVRPKFLGMKVDDIRRFTFV
jgi:hypothetical protein